ncbi:MAG TPA: hypothetical protein VF743_08955, partial [Acidimicrobiales bacterium]
VAWVAEPGLRPTSAGPQAREGAAHMAMAAVARGEMPEEVIEVEPEEVVVDAAVDVGFAVAPAGRPPA